MSLKNLNQIQAETRIQMLHNLAMTCQRRFLLAADLVEISGPAIKGLREFGFQSVELRPLIPAWQCLCLRYQTELDDPQMSLFQEHDRLSQLREAWGQFVYWKLIPKLVQDDSLVRNVLRSLGGLPCQSPEQAANAVYQHFLEMTLPDTRPPWAAEEILD
jgi:hypothetical protein